MKNKLYFFILFFFSINPKAFAFSDLILLTNQEKELSSKILLIGDIHRVTDQEYLLHPKLFFSLATALTQSGSTKPSCVYEIPDERSELDEVAPSFKFFLEKKEAFNKKEAPFETFENYDPRGFISASVHSFFEEIDDLVLKLFHQNLTEFLPKLNKSDWLTIQKVYNQLAKQFYKSYPEEKRKTASDFFNYYDEILSQAEDEDARDLLPDNQKGLLLTQFKQVKTAYQTLKKNLLSLISDHQSQTFLDHCIFALILKEGYLKTQKLFQEELDYAYSNYMYLKKILHSFQAKPEVPLIYVLGKTHTDFLQIQLQKLGFQTVNHIKPGSKKTDNGLSSYYLLKTRKITLQFDHYLKLLLQKQPLIPFCSTCKKETTKRCPDCHAYYCSPECFKAEFKDHKGGACNGK